MQQGIRAQQGGGALPSETLTQIASADNCTVYSFNYPSVNVQGEPIVLSSALFAWTPSDRQDTDSIESLHIYCHITITANYARPSTTERFSQEQGLLEAMPGRTYGSASSGGSADYAGRCIIIAPDYEGYGVTRDLPHPYLSQRTTAQQVLDAVRYGLKLYEKTVSEGTVPALLPMKSDWRSFCMGYSQGGAVSLATQRLIEEGGYADELRFQGSICGDGPYDLVNTVIFYLEDDGTSYGVQTPHRKGVVTYPVVMPLIIKGMYDSHPAMAPYNYEDFLSRQILDTGVLGWIDSKAYSADDISKKWYNQLQEGLDTLGRHYTPEQMAELFESPSSGKVWGKLEKMFTKDVYDYFSDPSNFHHVPEHPANAAQALHVALADNAVSTGWEPHHRIQFFHSKCDIIVPYGNYLVFQGAHPLCRDMYSLDDTFSEGDHFDAGTVFLVDLLAAKLYGDVFNWICGAPTDVRTVQGEFSILNYQLSILNGEWYDLNGRRLTGKPTRKGIYIHRGRRVHLTSKP
jgi:hypothetical protein